MKRATIRSAAEMVSLYAVAALVGGLFLSACNKPPMEQAEGKVRVGTYDSRAIVAAYFFGQFYDEDQSKQIKAAKQLQLAIEIQQKEPIPLEEAQKMDWSKE